MKRIYDSLKWLVCGLCIGGMGVAPGVSGGALAASFGVYPLLVDAAAHPISALKHKSATLLPLGTGMLLGIILFGQVVSYLFSAYEVVARCTVAGMMLGTLPKMTREAIDNNPRNKRFLGLSLFTFFVGLWLLRGGFLPKIHQNPSFCEWVLCGGIYAFGTVVPGISASCILVSMNGYENVLSVMAGRNLAALLPLFIGFAVAAAALVCIVNHLYTNHPTPIQFAVIGFLSASIIPVIPPITPDKTGVVATLCALLAAVGMWWAGEHATVKSKSLTA